MSILSSCRNHSIDLHIKSIDWFLYQGNTGISWVKLAVALYTTTDKESLKMLFNFYTENAFSYITKVAQEAP